MSNLSAATVTPSMSASNVASSTGGGSATTAKSGRKSRRGGGSKGGTPVPTPSPSVMQTAPPSLPSVGAMPLTGWKDTLLCGQKQEIRPLHTMDAQPFMGLVNSNYNHLVAKNATGIKHTPRALFVHYCALCWWYRMLHVQMLDGAPTDPLVVEFISQMQISDLHVPTFVAQYLSCLGNFAIGGELFHLRMVDFAFGERNDPYVQKGWFETEDPANRVTNETFWLCAQTGFARYHGSWHPNGGRRVLESADT
ncbi:unnamed protein product [Hapterophycus canaliculatus]